MQMALRRYQWPYQHFTTAATAVTVATACVGMTPMAEVMRRIAGATIGPRHGTGCRDIHAVGHLRRDAIEIRHHLLPLRAMRLDPLAARALYHFHHHPVRHLMRDGLGQKVLAILAEQLPVKA